MPRTLPLLWSRNVDVLRSLGPPGFCSKRINCVERVSEGRNHHMGCNSLQRRQPLDPGRLSADNRPPVVLATVAASPDLRGGSELTAMTEEMVLGADLVLLLVAAPTTVESARGRINGITRLEKLLFLADKEFNVQSGVVEPLQFKAYHYGPYAKEVYEAVELLEEAGLLTETRRSFDEFNVDTGDDMEELEADATEESAVERQFILTDNGRTVADALFAANPGLREPLSKIKNQYAERSLTSLIRYVYTKYSDYASKSKIRDQFL